MRFEEYGNIKGKMCYLDVHKAPLFDMEGNLIGTVGSGRDITVEKELELKIEQAHETFKVLLDASLDSLFIFDENQNCIHSNSNASDLTGYSSNEIIGKCFFDFISESDIPLAKERINKPCTETYPLKVKHKSGHTINVLISVKNMTYLGNQVHVVAVVDITEIERSRQRLEDAQRIAHMGNCEWHFSDDIVQLSDEAYRIYGYEPNEAKFDINFFMSHIHPEDIEHTRSKLQISLNTKNEFSHEHRIITKDGEIRHILVTAVPNFDHNNQVQSMIGTVIDLTQQVKTQNEINRQKNVLEYQAHYDNLTGLANRTLFIDRLLQLIKKAERNNTKVATLFIDLDRFKEINDSLGHGAGDIVLQEVAKRLQATVRESDNVARLGGDEFTIIIDELHNTDIIVDIANKLSKAMEEPIPFEGNPLYLSMRIGASIYPDDGTDTETLIKNADAAMYKAKEDGRNTYRFYTQGMTEKAFERVALEASLRQALKNEEFVVYYQPQTNADTHTLYGMEALIRWNHPSLGIVPPAHFIKLAEETGLILQIDRWMMEQAMQQFNEWKQQGFEPGILSVNLAIQQIYQEDFIEVLQDIIQRVGYDSSRLELEISEGQIMKDPERAIQVLHKVKELGLSLSIDDFGTGYSSLSYLKKLPIDSLKIDQSFTFNLPNDEEDAAIINTIIALAKSLGLKTIAEGVEKEEQCEFMHNKGCDVLQGYFFSRPKSKTDIEDYMQNIGAASQTQQ